jgi:CBS domain-containing protein
MSPRAACRLETLGFGQVYDYAAGEADWLAHGLPIDGEAAGPPTAGRLARDDVVTCRLGDRVEDVRGRIAASPYGFGLVTGTGGVLLGRLRRSRLTRTSATQVEEVMEAGPSTVRPHTPAAELAKRLAARDLQTAIVTTPEGVLLGVVRRRELEAAAGSDPPPAE